MTPVSYAAIVTVQGTGGFTRALDAAFTSQIKGEGGLVAC